MFIADRDEIKLPGNHGQFGESAATEAYRPLRATQRVTVRPVIPRCPDSAISDVRTSHPCESEGSPVLA